MVQRTIFEYPAERAKPKALEELGSLRPVAVGELDERSTEQIERLLAPLTADQMSTVTESMTYALGDQARADSMPTRPRESLGPSPPVSYAVSSPKG